MAYGTKITFKKSPVSLQQENVGLTNLTPLSKGVLPQVSFSVRFKSFIQVSFI